MTLQEVKENEKDQYNQFIAAQASGSFLQAWEWGDWQATLGRQVVRLKILDSGGQWLGAVQFIKMPIWGNKHYIYAPYGPVLDLRFKIQDLKILTEELQKKFSHAAFIRIEPKDLLLTTHNLQRVTKSANIQPGKTLVIDLSQSEELLLASMHHKTRYNIKVAQKHGVDIKDEFSISVGHGLFFDEALKLIQETSKRQKFTTFTQDYYKNMADFFVLSNKPSALAEEINSRQPADLSDVASAKLGALAKEGVLGNKGDVSLHIYKAIFQSQLLGAAFMVDFGNTRTFLFGGSSEFHKNVMAPYLLHWKAMADAKAAGLNYYDFWGIETSSGETPGFVRFKMGFAPQQSSGSSSGQEKEYGGAYDIINNKLFYKTYSLGRALNKFRKKISPK